MFNYELKNNHYIINIDGKKYLLDTGTPSSFWITPNSSVININNKMYRLSPKPSILDVRLTEELVGTHLDGFIGLDIVLENSITIYKNGFIDFNEHEVSGGTKLPMFINPYFLKVGVNVRGLSGEMIIDTGAMVGYAVDELFENLIPSSRIGDYNPSLGKLNSDLYNMNLTFTPYFYGSTNICKNHNVDRVLRRYGAILIANISSFFNEVCVIDINDSSITFK